jgi:hypothetical protein
MVMTIQHSNTPVNERTGIAKTEEAPRYMETSLSQVMCPRKTEDGPGARAHNGRPYLSKGRNDVNFFITVTVQWWFSEFRFRSRKKNSLRLHQPNSDAATASNCTVCHDS